MLEVKPEHFESIFERLEYTATCPGSPSTSIGLYFVRHDRDGQPNWKGLVGLILGYITQFCFTAEKRKELTEFERNAINQQARELFRKDPKTGQPGELLVYLFIEAVLGAPQVLKKMPLTTNPNEERKGSDGVHIRITDGGLLELIFAEAKLFQTFNNALAKAFKSMGDFYTSPTKALEKSYFTKGYSEVPEPLKDLIVSFLEGKNVNNSREVYACLVGFDWAEYKCLTDSRRAAFVEEFKERYIAWAQRTMIVQLQERIASFPHKHLKLEFFFVPFESVAEFRKAFLDSL